MQLSKRRARVLYSRRVPGAKEDETGMRRVKAPGAGLVFAVASIASLTTASLAPALAQPQGAAAVARCRAVFLRADRQEGGAGGGQRLCARARADVRVAVCRRSAVPPLLRRAVRHAARAHAELAGLGRDRQRRRHRRHQHPRRQDRRRHRDPHCAGRSARVRRQGHPAGRQVGHRRAQDRRRRRALSLSGVRGLRHPRGRRPGAGDRQPVRRRPDRDQRHHLGAGAHRCRPLRRPGVHPDRCRHQSRQLRRRADRHGGQGGGHQHGDLLPLRRLARRGLCHSLQPGEADRRQRGHRAQAAAALARRQARCA